ncbi:glycosyltransferase family 39 protein [Nocardioides baekrokdamisoli]|uniref:glycosyltransferase family 39 protein n=1 Tax=Nocardioides baekrokdamisoli TaxID=1804624 RepID=UPI000F76BC5D|nr:glycosyltransferase family 39 protein [Nocardioides baekrokdamisoli]
MSVQSVFTRERQVLALIVLAGLALASAHLASAPLTGYYATAVRSMSGSWHAWFFGALDPASTISVDKVPGWLQIQALFVRVLGFHGWVIELPQILAEGVSIVALYAAVRRWRGVPTARLAAALFVLTPIVTPTFAHAMEDGPLACCLILALDRAHRAAVTGATRSLIASALWIALGFQMKMAEAWLVLPAVLIAYSVCAPVSGRVRALRAVVATAVCVLASLLWVTIVALVPAGSRPYVDGTSTDNVFTMVFGYNGLERLGIHLPGAMPQGLRLAHPVFVPGDGWAKLIDGHLLPQIGWLIPLTLAGIVVGWRTNRGLERAGWLLWSGAWVTFALVLSAVGRLPHAAYVVVLAAPMAALSAAFLVDLVTMRRRTMAVVVVFQSCWSAWVWAVEPSFVEWLRWGVVAIAVLLLVNLHRLSTRALATVVTATLLIGPAAWTASTLNPAYAGSDVEATAGPPGPLLASVATPAQVADFGADGADFVAPTATLSGDAAKVWQIAKQRQGSARFPLTTVGWFIAQPFILATGEPVWPIGGYSHLVPTPTLAEFQAAVRSGEVRMVLLGAYGFRAAIQDGSASTDIVQWVAGHCARAGSWIYPPSGQTTAAVHLFDCSNAL